MSGLSIAAQTGFEVIRPGVRRGPYRVALFDFDGTLSLFREGWVDVMVGYGVEILRTHGNADDPDEDLNALVREFVLALTGKPPHFQMKRLAEEVEAYGGTPAEPDVYVEEYVKRLMGTVLVRRAQVAEGTIPPDDWAVPNSRDLLANLRDRGVTLYLASGTDGRDVYEELALLGLAEFFGPNVFAPGPHAAAGFSKADVIDRILKGNDVSGEQLLGFGDGDVETKAVKAVGGTAVAVASNPAGEGGVSGWKRGRLVSAGADVVVGDFRGQAELVAWLFGER